MTSLYCGKKKFYCHAILRMIFLDNIIFPPKETMFEFKKINKTPPPQKKPPHKQKQHQYNVRRSCGTEFENEARQLFGSRPHF